MATWSERDTGMVAGSERGVLARVGLQRLALRPDEAAEALGVGRSFFYTQVLPELRVVRRGRLRLVPVTELERWLERNAARALQ